MRTSRFLAAVAMLAMVLPAIASIGCRQPGGAKISLIPADKELEEEVVIREGLFRPKIAIVEVDGLLIDQETGGLLTEGENPVAYVKEQLDKARNDSAVKGVILRINSPGGTVTASEIIHDEVRRFKQKSGKPVAAVMMSVTASGGYYVACATDRLIAYPTTVTGSIGVIMQLFSLQGTMEAIHLRTYAIKSGRFKDAGSPLRDLEPAEREIFEEIVQQFYEKFLSVVRNGRPNMSAEQIKAVADGRVFTGQQALDYGMVDEVGNIYTAIQWLKDKTDHERMNVVVYHRPLQYKGNIYARQAGGSPQAASAGPLSIDMGAVQDALRPKFLYLWAPGLVPTR